MYHLMNNRQIRRFGLKDDQSLLIFTPGTSCHLGHQLESTLIAPEVREVQHRIRIQNPHHTDMIKVQSFGHHLRTNQDIGLALFKIRDNFLVCGTGTGGIQIHPGDFRLGKYQFYIIFYTLCTETAMHQFHSAARRAGTGNLIGISAVMASQLVQPLMIRQTHITVLAFRNPAAGMTFYHWSETATVLKQDNLLLTLQCLFYLLDQHR